MSRPDKYAILNCIHGKFYMLCRECANCITGGDEAAALEPLFLDVSVFERPATNGFTAFEVRLFEALLTAPGAVGLNFAERMAVLEAMREGALLLLARIEENK